MHNLIYLSSASHLFSNEELLEILTISRLNNSKLDVSGLLLYHEGSILQILEGEEGVIKTLFQKISRDQRHRGVIKMIDGSIEERSFADWSMGFKQISNKDWSEVQGYLDFKKKDQILDIVVPGNQRISTVIKTFTNVNTSMRA
ncbi:MAG: BLUF domain-containing protein [Chitinophagaceae bacterium]